MKSNSEKIPRFWVFFFISPASCLPPPPHPGLPCSPFIFFFLFVHYNHIHPPLILFLPFGTMELGNLCFGVRLMTVKAVFLKLVTGSWNQLHVERSKGGGRSHLPRAGELVLAIVTCRDPVLFPVALRAPLLLSGTLRLRCLFCFQRTKFSKANQ